MEAFLLGYILTADFLAAKQQTASVERDSESLWSWRHQHMFIHDCVNMQF